MGIVIAAVTAETGDGDPLERAAAAARRAMATARIGPHQVDALINTGGRPGSQFTGEAVSALIGRRAGIGDSPRADGLPCLTIDLYDGPASILQAVQVAHALLHTPAIHRVLLVSGDDRPAKSPPRPDFPAAAAILLEHHPNHAIGFTTLHVSAESAAEGGTGAPAAGRFAAGPQTDSDTGASDDDGPPAGAPRPQSAGHAAVPVEELLGHAVSAASEALEVAGVPVARAVLICGGSAPGFAALLAGRLGIAADAVRAGDAVGGAPGSALPVAYLAALDSGRLADADVALFVAAGPGAAAAAIAYRLPKP